MSPDKGGTPTGGKKKSICSNVNLADTYIGL